MKERSPEIVIDIVNLPLKIAIARKEGGWSHSHRQGFAAKLLVIKVSPPDAVVASNPRQSPLEAA